MTIFGYVRTGPKFHYYSRKWFHHTLMSLSSLTSVFVFASSTNLSMSIISRVSSGLVRARSLMASNSEIILQNVIMLYFKRHSILVSMNIPHNKKLFLISGHGNIWLTATKRINNHRLFSVLCSSASLCNNWSAKRLALVARPLFKSSQSNWTISKCATVGSELISRARQRNFSISWNNKSVKLNLHNK